MWKRLKQIDTSNWFVTGWGGSLSERIFAYFVCLWLPASIGVFLLIATIHCLVDGCGPY